MTVFLFISWQPKLIPSLFVYLYFIAVSSCQSHNCIWKKNHQKIVRRMGMTAVMMEKYWKIMSHPKKIFAKIIAPWNNSIINKNIIYRNLRIFRKFFLRMFITLRLFAWIIRGVIFYKHLGNVLRTRSFSSSFYSWLRHFLVLRSVWRSQNVNDHTVIDTLEKSFETFIICLLKLMANFDFWWERSYSKFHFRLGLYFWTRWVLSETKCCFSNSFRIVIQ